MELVTFDKGEWVLDPGVLSSVVGRWVELRPAAGQGASGGSGPSTGWDNPLEAAVVSTTERSQLRLETTDERILELEERAVFAEFGSSEALFRVQGMLEILVKKPPPVVCLLTPFERPEAVQRRQWVRVRTVVPVEIDRLADEAMDAANDAIDSGNVVRTVSLDLSGGGIRLRDGKGIGIGTELTMAVELPSGPVEVRGVVLEIHRNGDARVTFLNPPESVRGKIVRHVFDVQMEVRRSRTVANT